MLALNVRATEVYEKSLNAFKKQQEKFDYSAEKYYIATLTKDTPVGAGLTLEQYIDLLFFRGNEYSVDCGYVSYGSKSKNNEHQIPNVSGQNNNKKQEKNWVSKSFHLNSNLIGLYNCIEINNKSLDQYMSFNTYYRAGTRKQGDLRQINAFYVDLDIYTKKKSLKATQRYLDNLIRKNLLPPYTFFVSSGRGCYAIWCVNHLQGKSRKVLKKTKQIQNHICNLLKNYGSDAVAKALDQPFRIPGTYNTKAGKRAEILCYNEEAYYELEDFFEFVPFEKDKVDTKPKRKSHLDPTTRPKGGKIKRLYNPYTLFVARLQDIEKLIELRNFDVRGSRNNFLFVYHYYQMKTKRCQIGAARKETIELNSRFLEPLEEEEVLNLIQSSENRAIMSEEVNQEHGYRYKTSTLLRLYDITEEEEKHLKTLISNKTKSNRRNEKERKARRNKEGLTKREAQKIENFNTVVDLFQQGYKQIDIARKTNLSKSYISQIIKEYRMNLKCSNNHLHV